MHLKDEIDNIWIIDDHFHAFNDVYWRDVVGDRPHEFQFDRLEIPRKLTPIHRSQTLSSAYRDLYNFPHPNITPDNFPELDSLYRQSDEASTYLKAMDKAKIEWAFEICMSNADLPPELDSNRYKRVAYIDGLIIPLDNSEIKKSSDQTERFVMMAEAFSMSVRKTLDRQPSSFQEYLNLVSSVLEKLKESGCIALKLNLPYWRDIAVEVVGEEDAHNVFQSRDTAPKRYKVLQDFLIRKVIAKAAELDLPVQIHTGGIGPERSIKEGDPSRIDGFLWLPDVRQAKVVLLHGGYPYCREAGAMVSRMWNQRKTSLDISWMWWGLNGSPISLVRILREWIEMGLIRRLIYGSDAGNPHQLWLSASNIRRGLYLALKGMIDDGMIDEDQALTMAEFVLRGNAESLYGL